MSVAERNRAALSRAFKELEKGNADAFMALFSEDITWRVMGSSYWSREAKGLANVQKDLMGPLFSRFAAPYLNIPELVIADGDHVVVLARGDTTTTEGQRYNNDYCFAFRLEAGKIVSVREYLDTKLADAVLGTG
ncbi:nuclear transport factor 2 family protein [Novosphingobium malaysiense]|uniref:SnoaL-like domain-containing protein n=1 Tax=Novosphingobium malaysiense TaxID=1348853 RepID=A0A0B1ZKG0_9SPHN|nr:nuclear transport factor 2 family protein [Novosphingobium malaysiense]KHK89631.1 hypothetical protein LK12_21395 [Novosphingobium malaysiense]